MMPAPLSVSAARHSSFIQRTGRVLSIGYVPLLDSAPLVVAHGLGFFQREGLATSLRRQPGWACVRDKMLYGTLDVAHAPAGFLFAINAGATANVGRCITAFVMSAQGNAITLSHRLKKRGVRDVKDLATEVRARRGEPLTLGIVSRHSTHAHLLGAWLARSGLNLEKEVRVVILPPQQMVATLASGHLDGFCAGEPWNSIAVADGHGWITADSASLAPMHPEKVLLVHEDFAREHHEEHMSLLRALVAACAWCADAGNRSTLVKLMSKWVFPDLSEKRIHQALSSSTAPIFQAPGLHEPSVDKAGWVLGEMRRLKLLPKDIPDQLLSTSFRVDLYEAMTPSASATHREASELAAEKVRPRKKAAVGR